MDVPGTYVPGYLCFAPSGLGGMRCEREVHFMSAGECIGPSSQNALLRMTSIVSGYCVPPHWRLGRWRAGVHAGFRISRSLMTMDCGALLRRTAEGGCPHTRRRISRDSGLKCRAIFVSRLWGWAVSKFLSRGGIREKWGKWLRGWGIYCCGGCPVYLVGIGILEVEGRKTASGVRVQQIPPAGRNDKSLTS